MSTIDIDKMNSVKAARVVEQAFRIIDVISDAPAEEQPMAVALLFSLINKRFNLNPKVTLERAENLKWDIIKDRPDLWRAIRAYIGSELR